MAFAQFETDSLLKTRSRVTKEAKGLQKIGNYPIIQEVAILQRELTHGF
jgi:hypothetical protein